MKRIKFSPFLKDLWDTFITSVATIVALVITLRVLAEGLGPEKFGAYSLARRLLTILDPLVMLTMGIAVTRYIAMTKDERTRLSYLLGGLFLGVSPSLILLLVGLILKNELSALIFRHEIYTSLFVATLVLSVGYSFFIILYAFYRGRGNMRKANLWQLGIIAIGPMLIAIQYANSGRVDTVILLAGVLCFSAMIPLLFHLVKAVLFKISFPEIRKSTKILLQYGLPRVPGGFAFPGILAIGPFLAPHLGTLKYAGYLLAGQSILRVVEGGTEAFGRAALPKLAQLQAQGDTELLKGGVTNIIALVFHLGLFGTLHLLIWTDQIVLLLLGGKYLEAISIMQILILALMPYLAYSLLRSVIDAVDEKAVNTKNAYQALFVTAVFSLLLPLAGLGILGLALGTTIGFYVLGFLSIRYLWRIYNLERKTLILGKILPINIGLMLLALLVKQALPWKTGENILLVTGFLIELVLFAFYGFILWRMKVEWITEIKKRIV